MNNEIVWLRLENETYGETPPAIGSSIKHMLCTKVDDDDEDDLRKPWAEIIIYDDGFITYKINDEENEAPGGSDEVCLGYLSGSLREVMREVGDRLVDYLNKKAGK